MNVFKQRVSQILMCACILFGLQGCVGTIIGTAVDATIEVAKIPFKVGKAAVDVVTGDDKKDEDK
jgi:hypothetical protein